MKTSIAIIVSLLVPWSTLTFAAPSSKRFNLQTMVNNCKAKFDITPFIVKASGGKNVLLSTPFFVYSMNYFEKTGHVPLTQAQQNDPEARTCAAFSEGLLTSTINTDNWQSAGNQIMKTALDSCTVKVGSDDENGDATKSNPLQTWLDTGLFPLTSEQAKDPSTLYCVNFIEGDSVGTLLNGLVKVVSNSTAQKITQVANDMVQTLVGSVGERK